jgi:hypothetical protein
MQWHLPGVAEFVPAIRVVFYLKLPGLGLAASILEAEVPLLHVVDLPSSGLGGQKHGKSAVFMDFDRPYRIHHYTDFYTHVRHLTGNKNRVKFFRKMPLNGLTGKEVCLYYQ